MNKKVIRAFNLFNLQFGSESSAHDFTQRVIYCGASQIQEALIHILKASNNAQRKWMQRFLQIELNYILMGIGQLCALGWDVQIPFIIRSLADSLAAAPAHTLPLKIKDEFLMAVASATAENSLDKRVESYVHDWWTLKDEPPTSEALNRSNMQEIIAYHERQFLKTFGISFDDALSDAPTLGPDDPSGNTSNDPIIDPVPTLKLIQPIQLVPDATKSSDCENCNKLHDLSVDLLNQLRGAKAIFASHVVSACNQVGCVGRRALALFELYEASQRLADNDGTLGSAASNADNILGPQGKWTWGRDLTIKEVSTLAAGQVSDPGRYLHTGYKESLEDGSLISRSQFQPKMTTSDNSAKSVTHTHSGIGPDDGGADCNSNANGGVDGGPAISSAGSDIASEFHSTATTQLPPYFEFGTDGESTSSQGELNNGTNDSRSMDGEDASIFESAMDFWYSPGDSDTNQDSNTVAAVDGIAISDNSTESDDDDYSGDNAFDQVAALFGGDSSSESEDVGDSAEDADGNIQRENTPRQYTVLDFLHLDAGMFDDEDDSDESYNPNNEQDSDGDLNDNSDSDSDSDSNTSDAENME
ncbi:hypothetical protein JR316_0005636 [Psilocybe cubensis]|uniref:Uncharacterized protein n=2 Tax=Psilocybe cubensis TaxID=181762 RepID=A0A8H8CLV6_PSICU|nr:hypothetical protein JR316_0005636 [Psilocybe cubensis]KAH9481116.1 hypothetical protein JR316_0005636 [Psilocybe cubensis]